MKITYDLNNKEECEEIENYYFYKDYLESLLFDWKNMVKMLTDDDWDKKPYAIHIDPLEFDEMLGEQLHNILLIAIKHQNYHQFKRLTHIYVKYFNYEHDYIYDEKYIFLNIICCAKLNIKQYKKYLLNKYGEKH